MTDNLDPQILKDLINYRMERAAETLKAADYLSDGGFYNIAVGRLYYACFYAASALMLANNLSAATHAGIKVLLNLNFIKKGILESKYGGIYQQLFEKRQSGDYEDFIYCDSDLYGTLRPQAEDFIRRLKELIEEVN